MKRRKHASEILFSTTDVDYESYDWAFDIVNDFISSIERENYHVFAVGTQGLWNGQYSGYSYVDDYFWRNFLDGANDFEITQEDDGAPTLIAYHHDGSNSATFYEFNDSNPFEIDLYYDNELMRYDDFEQDWVEINEEEFWSVVKPASFSI